MNSKLRIPLCWKVPIPFPTGTPTSAPFLVPTTARSLSITTYNHVSPYTQNWNFEIQREVARNTTVEIRYIGTKGTKIWGSEPLNAINALHHNKELFDAFNIVRAGGDSPLLTSMLRGINLGGTGAKVVDGTTWTGAMAVRTNTTTRAQLANGNVGGFVNTLNTLNTGTGSSDNGAVLRKNGFPENYIVADPQYANVNLDSNLTNSKYHSMQLQFTKRLTSGFTNTTTWTWSKSMSAGAVIDTTNRNADKALQSSDHTHQLTSNGTYELPFGTGHFLLGNAPGWVQQVVNKWQLGGIMNFNSGAPLSISSGIQTIGTAGARPNVVGAIPKDMGKAMKVSNGVVYFEGYTQIDDPYKSQVSTLNGLQTAFNNKAVVAPNGQVILVNPQPGEMGTLGYATIKGPSSINFDMNLVKRFKLSESKEFEFRLDAINVLNHPNWGNPNTSINSTSFGLITSASGSRSFILNSRINF